MTAFVLFSDKMPFFGKTDEAINEMSCAGELDKRWTHGEPQDLQVTAAPSSSAPRVLPLTP